MSDIQRDPIVHPSAWTSAEASKATFSIPLTEPQIGAFEALLSATRQTEPLAVRRDQFEHPEIAPLVAQVREQIMEGTGVAILTGLTRERFSDEDFTRIYWGLGTQLGVGQAQNSQGDLLGYVEEDPDRVAGRGYRSAAELSMHTDSFEMVGLMCVQRGETGGESSLASALTVYNEILRTRPDLLEALYEGYYFWLPEKKVGVPTTDDKLPVFCNVDGLVSCNYAGSYMREAAKIRGETIPGKLSEGIDLFGQIVARPDIRAEFLLDPGDIMLWNNFTCTHSRRSFTNSPERKRFLLRLWLTLREGEGRPVTPRFQVRNRNLAKLYGERQPA
jgi:hypothetical protein